MLMLALLVVLVILGSVFRLDAPTRDEVQLVSKSLPCALDALADELTPGAVQSACKGLLPDRLVDFVGHLPWK